MSPERASRRLSRRHPDIEVARLLVKHGLLEKSQAVVALKEQKRRAKETKPRVPFLRFLLKREFLNETTMRVDNRDPGAHPGKFPREVSEPGRLAAAARPDDQRVARQVLGRDL